MTRQGHTAGTRQDWDLNSGGLALEPLLRTAAQPSLPIYPDARPPDSITPPHMATATTLCSQGPVRITPSDPGASRPHLPGPLVQNLLPSLPCPPLSPGPTRHFFVVDLVLFCFFPFTPFPGRLSKATFCHQGTQKGQGRSRHLGLSDPQPPAFAQL